MFLGSVGLEICRVSLGRAVVGGERRNNKLLHKLPSAGTAFNSHGVLKLIAES